MAWIGVVGTLAGVIVAGGITMLRDLLRIKEDRRRRDHDLLQAKLEELCGVAEAVAQEYRDSRAEMSCFVAGEGPFTGDGKLVPWARLNTLVNFYAPELRETLDLLIGQRDLYSKAELRLLFVHKHESLDREEAKKRFEASVIELLRLSKQLQIEAAAKFRRHFDA